MFKTINLKPAYSLVAYQQYSYALVMALLLSSLALPVMAASKILAQERFIAPLSPENPTGSLKMAASAKADSTLPLWVSYKVLAISPKDKPNGRIVIDSVPELAKVPMGDSIVVLKSDDMDEVPRSGKFAEKFDKQAGGKSPEEIEAVFGKNLTQSILALRENKGSMFEKNIIKTYPVPEGGDVILLASIDKAEDLYPALVEITMGQGDVPDEYKSNFSGGGSKSMKSEKFIAALISFLIAGIYLYRQFKK